MVKVMNSRSQEIYMTTDLPVVYELGNNVYADAHVFVGCDFDDAIIRPFLYKPKLSGYSMACYNGFFVDCHNLVVSDKGYGQRGRVIAVNNGGLIFIGCSIFETVDEAISAIYDNYYVNEEPDKGLLGLEYIQGVRDIYALAQSTFGLE